VRWAAAAALALGAALVVLALATAGGDDGGGAAPSPVAAAAEAPPRGLEVWAAHGCGSCHAFEPANAQGEIAPDLTVSLDGKPAAFIRESIVDPSAAAEPGWSGDTMPQDFAARMTPQELDALVAFLAEG
jgi:cytochrome c553